MNQHDHMNERGPWLAITPLYLRHREAKSC